jgi:hypothetical protein
MTKYTSRPYNDPLKTFTVQPLERGAYYTSDSTFGIMRSSTEESPDLMNFNAENGSTESRASKETEGTYEKTYSKEGLFANPTSIWPSSFFFPSPPVLKGLFSGPAALIDNYQLLVGIIAVVAVSSTGGDSNDVRYSQHYRTLPQQVIDNQDLENQFFGDQ